MNPLQGFKKATAVHFTPCPLPKNQKNLRDKSGNWLHRWIDVKGELEAVFEDYAYFL